LKSEIQQIAAEAGKHPHDVEKKGLREIRAA
jgi:hypothetical protein